MTISVVNATAGLIILDDMVGVDSPVLINVRLFVKAVPLDNIINLSFRAGDKLISYQIDASFEEVCDVIETALAATYRTGK